MENSPSWLAQGSAWVANNVLMVERFADYNDPVKTGTLTALLVVLAFFFGLAGKWAKKPWSRGIWLTLCVIVVINILTITFSGIERWT